MNTRTEKNLCTVWNLVFSLFHLTLLLAVSCFQLTHRKNKNINIFFICFCIEQNAKEMVFDENCLASFCVMIIYHCSKSGNVNCPGSSHECKGKMHFFWFDINMAVRSDIISSFKNLIYDHTYNPNSDILKLNLNLYSIRLSNIRNA